MKRYAFFAWLILPCVPAMAQGTKAPSPSGGQGQRIELELLELEQDVDKSILRKALMLRGRMDMATKPEGEPEKSRFVADVKALEAVIEEKKTGLIARAAELAKLRSTPRPPVRATSSTDGLSEADLQALIEKIETNQVETELLQTQANHMEQRLRQSIQEVVNAELTASRDESQRGKAEEARKAYENNKIKYVDLKKKLGLKQRESRSMGGGMSGLSGGLGGGFR